MKKLSTPWFTQPYFAVSAVMALVALSLFLVVTITENEVQVLVSPTTTNPLYNKVQSTQGNIALYAQGKLVLTNLNPLQKLAFGNSMWYGGLTDLVAIALIIIYLYVRRQLRAGTELKDSISQALRMAGFICAVGYFLNAGLIYYAKYYVLTYTQHQFTWQEPARNVYLLWLGIVFIWFSGIYKRAIWLQQEQSLTV